MALSNAEVTYFITQVGLSAASFGVATADVTFVGTALASLFGVRCAPETTVIPAQGAHLQSICIAEDCPLSPNATCAAYEAVVEPAAGGANNTVSATGSATSGSPSATGTASTTAGGAGGAATTASGTRAPTGSSTVTPASAGVVNSVGLAAVFGAVAAFFL